MSSSTAEETIREANRLRRERVARGMAHDRLTRFAAPSSSSSSAAVTLDSDEIQLEEQLQALSVSDDEQKLGPGVVVEWREEEERENDDAEPTLTPYFDEWSEENHIYSHPDVKRYLEKHVQRMVDRRATNEEWIALLIDHSLGQMNDHFSGFAALAQINHGQPRPRIPFTGEVDLLFRLIPVQTLEEIRIFCWEQFYWVRVRGLVIKGVKTTSKTWRLIADWIAHMYSMNQEPRYVTREAKDLIRQRLAEVRRRTNATDEEWAALLLEFTGGIHGYQDVQFRASSMGGANRLGHYQPLLAKPAIRELRMERFPRYCEDKFLVSLLSHEERVRMRRGVIAMCLDARMLHEQIFDSTYHPIGITSSRVKRYLFLSVREVSFDELAMMIIRVLDKARDIDNALNTSNIGTVLHRERELPKAVVNSIFNDYLGASKTLRTDRVTSQMEQRIATTRMLLNTKLEQLAKYGRLDTSDGRRRVRKSLREVAGMIEDAADAMDIDDEGEEEEEEGEEKKNKKKQKRSEE
jgi:hypothetical protein